MNSIFCNSVPKYEIILKIGQGSFGEVFKAREIENPTKIVAIKKIPILNEIDGFPIAELREAKILQQLKHNNIVKFIETCRTQIMHEKGRQAFYYLIFEFCDHELAGLLENANVVFGLGEVKEILRQMFNGVSYLHNRHILHRDLKPSNVLIKKNGVLKIADFGSARTITLQQMEQGSLTNNIVTLWYRAPELLLGACQYGPSIDIWSVGCIFAEICTRTPILQGICEIDQLKLIIQLCGSITPKVWPGVEQLQLYYKIQFSKQTRRKVITRFMAIMKNSHACDLLDKLLMLDPSKRIRANNALSHNFFWTDPMPSDLEKMMRQYKDSIFQFLAPRECNAQVGGNRELAG